MWVWQQGKDTNMRIAICDDNIEYINTIEDYLDEIKTPGLEHDIFMSGEELLKAYNNEEADYDAIFLDMEMGELDGIDTANLIRKIDRNVIIVFVTSHKQYMQRSFVCTPFRFLIKPLKLYDFKKVFSEVQVKFENSPETFIFLENKKKTRLYCSDIIFFESSSHWILIYTREGKVHKTRKSMNELIEAIHNSTFVRVHRAFVINLMHIHQISETDVVMNYHNQNIPIGRTYKKELTDEFLNYKERKYLL